MAEVRIYKQNEELLKQLKLSKDEPSGPFDTYADALVFAATLALKRDRRTSFSKKSEEIYPIDWDTFKKVEHILNLIALTANNGDPKILADDHNTISERARIFEEYANAGLEILQEYLQSGSNIMQRLLLLLDNERQTDNDEELDFSELLGMDMLDDQA